MQLTKEQAERELVGKIHCCDCLDLMAKMPDNYVDLCYADPPFRIGKSLIGSKHRNYSMNNIELSDIKTYKRWCKKWFKEARRISKKIVITSGVVAVPYYPEYIWMVIISKPSTRSFNKFGGYNCYEPLLIYDKPLKRLPRDVVIYDSLNVKNSIEKQHPCPDNHNMVAWIIDLWSEKYDIIYDPFMGSGTTAAMAIKYNRRWLGSEINPEYVAIANKRIQPLLDQYNLFEVNQ